MFYVSLPGLEYIYQRSSHAERQIEMSLKNVRLGLFQGWIEPTLLRDEVTTSSIVLVNAVKLPPI